MKKILPLLVLLFSVCILSAQTTYDFTTSPVLTNQTGFPSIWKNLATITVDGVEYVLTAGGNGTWTHLGNSGNGNSACIRKDGSGGDQLYIQRKDGKAFKFYGIWIKHSSMYMLPYYQPPYYTINYMKSAGGTQSYTYNNPATSSTETYTEDISVTSVQIQFSSIMYFWIDDLKVGPATISTPLSATTSQIAVSCNGGSNGSASVTASGGTAPYTYSWSPSGGTGATASGLSVGTYTCTITDATSASITKNFTITQPPAFNVSGSSTNVTCYGGSNGSATVTVSGATSPYSYSWSPSGGTASTASGLSVGSYTCTITDANSCTTVKNFTITQPAPAVISILSHPTDKKINIGANTTFAVSAQNATGYQWQVNKGIGFSDIQNITPYSGVTTATLTITGATAGMNGYAYRCIALGSCESSATSTAATLSTISNDATLQGISIDQGTLSPSFSGETTNYSIEVSSNTSSISITPIAGNESSSLTINGNTATNNSPVNISLNGGINTVTIKVTAEDEITTLEYTLNIIRLFAQVETIERANSAITNQSTLTFTIRFNGKVYGLTSENLALTGNGTLENYSIQSVSQTSASTYNISVNTGTGDGQLNLNLVNGTGLTAPIENLPFNGDNGYVIDKTKPVIKGKNITIQLGSDGTGVISAANLNNGSTDNYSENISFTASKTIFSGSDLGENTITLTGTDEAGNSNSTNTLVTVIKDIVSVKKPETINTTYGEELLLPATVSVTYADLSTSDVSVNWNLATYTGKAGVYVLDGTISLLPFTANSESLAAHAEVTVAKKSLTIGLQGNIEKEYDGNSSANIKQENYHTNKLTDDEITINGTGKYEDKKAGNAKNVTVTELSLSGDDAENYKLNTTTINGAVGNITQRTLIVTLLGIAEKVYDGTNTATVFMENYTSDKIMDDNILFSGTATYEDKNKGIEKNVQVTGLSISGEDAPNYSLQATEISNNIGVIHPKPVTASLQGSISKIYDGTISATIQPENYLLEGTIKEDDIKLNNPAAGEYDTKNKGIGKPVTVTGVSLAGEDAENYSLISGTLASSNGEIKSREITVQLQHSPVITKVYDGDNKAYPETQHYTLTGVQGDDMIGVTGTALYADKVAGENKIVTVNNFVLSGESKNNYNLVTTSAETTGSITAKHLTLMLSNSPSIEKVYDANNIASLLKENYILQGVLKDDVTSVTGTAVYADKHAGSDKLVTASGFTLNGDDKINYQLDTEEATATGKIIPKDIVLKLNAAPVITKVYDAGVNASLETTNYILENVENGDDLSVQGVATYSDKNAGTGKLVTVNNPELEGADKSNYHLITHSATVTGEIIPKTLEVTLNNLPQVTKTYDGKTDARIAETNYQVNGIIGNDEVLLNNPEAGTYEDKHAGDNKNVLIEGLAITGKEASNYVLSSSIVSGAIGTITRKSIQVAADDQIKIYGSGDPALTYKVTGLVGNDVISGGLIRQEGKNVGSYPISIGSVTGGVDYYISEFKPGLLTINRAELGIKAVDKSKKQGIANPVFTFDYTGFAGGDDPSDLTKAPVAKTTAIDKSAIGNYDILVFGAESENYNIHYTNGILTILPSGNKQNDLKVWKSGSELQVRVFVAEAQKANIILITESGQPVMLELKHLNAGINTFTLPVIHLAASTYVLSIEGRKFRLAQRVQVK